MRAPLVHAEHAEVGRAAQRARGGDEAAVGDDARERDVDLAVAVLGYRDAAVLSVAFAGPSSQNQLKWGVREASKASNRNISVS